MRLEKRHLVAVSILVVLLGLRTVVAQSRVSSPIGSGGALSANTFSSDVATANVLLSGNVITAEGSPPPGPVAIERVCGTKNVRVGYTDSKGFFSVRLTDSLPALQDASEGGQGAIAAYGVTSATVTGFGIQQPLTQQGFDTGLAAVTGCELRGVLSGYQSTSVMIIATGSLQAVNLGTIVLISGQEQGSTVSSTSIDAPKAAKKAYEKAVAYLKKRKPSEAQTELEQAVKLYPRYAVAWTQLGWLQIRQDHLEEARGAFAQAQAADDKFVPAYLGLASVAVRELKWTEAEPLSARVTEMDGVDFPIAYYYNALANLELGQYDKAEKAAHMAERLDTRQSLPPVKPLLSAILAGKHDYHQAAEVLRLYMKSVPAGPNLEKLGQQLAELEKLAASPDPAPAAKAVAFQPAAPPPAAPLATTPTREDIIKATNSTPLVAPIREDWAPPDIDEVVPPVRPNVPCTLNKVLSAASLRVKQLMDNLQQFSATERVENLKVDKEDDLQHPESTTFKYVAQIREVRPGELETEEYRDGNTYQAFPARLVTTGMIAHALMFHPSLIDDLVVTCEGLGSVGGKPAWQLHFVQRPDRPPRFREFRTPKGLVRVGMKGRAWIAADSYQVVRMETDLVKPVDEIGLRKDHVIIDYRPVDFPKRNRKLWLPETADLYLDLNGRRVHRRHTLSDFELFWVDTEQKTKSPAEPGPPG